MKISGWFNPRDIKHIKGYKHHQETGEWPQALYEEIIQLEDNYNFNLLFPKSSNPELLRFAQIKMAECWVERFIWDDKANKICIEMLNEIDEEARLEELFYIEHKEE